MSFCITDADIDIVQELLFPGTPAFDEERRAFLRCLDSVDVQACPGSGKTTLLVAKLLIIANRFPLPNNAGICVLTHTNGAVDQIKNKLAKQSDVLFRYPNFIGTIQTFVDKFLAIPYFVSIYGTRPSVDDASFNFEIRKYQGVNTRELYGWLNNRQTTIESLRFSFEEFNVSPKLMSETHFVGVETDSYKQAKMHKLAVLKKGYLCFDDAYAIANRYLKKHPQLADLFSQRFQYVFVDEMQDTDVHQLRIIEKVFPRNKTTIQYIGDVNQSIYSGDVRNDLVWQINPDSMLKINGTKRLSQEIANVVQAVAVQPQVLSGVNRSRPIKPKLIIFDDQQIDQVIPTFCKLISKYGLHKDQTIKDPVFKVVGWVGKLHESKHTLVSYSSSYLLRRTASNSLCSWNDHLLNRQFKIDANSYKETILGAIISFLRLAQIQKDTNTRYTQSNMIELLKSQYPSALDLLNHQIAEWTKMLHAGENIHSDFRQFVANELIPRLTPNKHSYEESLDGFFAPQSADSLTNEKSPSIQRPAIDVQVETIHAVKGQNHTATLYVETFYNGYDIDKILNLFSSNSESTNTSSARATRNIQTMKMAYVAMSRPTHLLCLAIHANTPNARNHILTRDIQNIRSLHCEKWDIIEISENGNSDIDKFAPESTP